MHINLSGRALSLVRGKERIALPADPARPASVWREHTRKNSSDPMTEYQGRQLAPGLTAMNVSLDETGIATAVRMPVVALAAPDLAALAPALSDWWPPHLSYVYFHYPDHVEVATAFHITDDALDRPPTAGVPLVEFFLHNLGSRAIARIEIDGQTLGGTGLIPSLQDEACGLAAGLAITRLTASVKVRWQHAQAAPAWQRATAALAPFPPLAPSQGKPRDNAVHLYFLADGSVTAQRVQTLTLADGKPGVRSTEPAPAFKTPPTCGMASVTQAASTE